MEETVLGQDPEVETTNETPEQNESSSQETSTTEQTSSDTTDSTNSAPSLDDAQINTLRDKAGLLDQLEAIPGMAEHIETFIRSRNEQPVETDQNNTVTTNNDSAEIAALKSQITEMRNAMQSIVANQQINSFASQTPDFGEHRQAVGAVLQKHPTMSIEEAYKFVKLSNAQQANTRTVPAAQPKPSEVSSSPLNANSKADVIKSIMEASSDELAFQRAWEEAKRQNAGN